MDENQNPMSGYYPYDPQPKRSRSVSIGALAMIALICVIVTFLFTYVVMSMTQARLIAQLNANARREGLVEEISDKLAYVDRMIRENYVGEVDDEVLADWMMKGYMAGLGDPYAEYYTAEEFEAMIANSNAEMQGIGISITLDEDTGYIAILAVFPDSPAMEAGLAPGDMITYAWSEEEESYLNVASVGYTAALSMLQGKADTYAKFVAERDGEETEYSILRGYVTEYTVSEHLYAPDPTVGVIRISSFDAGTPAQFAAAVAELQAGGATALLLDVRFNPGGTLDSVCEILDTLLPEGVVVRTVDRDGNEEIVYTSDAEELTIPMAVVVNGNTASAGELFASALQDYKKAPIVGVQTYGKGSMQTVQGLPDGTGFKFTYRYYCPPFSDNYDGVGVTPDVTAEMSEAAASKNFYRLTDEEDDQLAAAYKALVRE